MPSSRLSGLECGRHLVRASTPPPGARGRRTLATGSLVALGFALALGGAVSPARALWEYESESHYVSIGGFVDLGNAIRLASPPDFNISLSAIEPPRVLLQRNQLKLSLAGSHPHEIYTFLDLDFIYASAPDFPFSDYNRVEIAEAYVDFRVKDIDFRVGKEKVIWGKADIISPFDILTSSVTKAPLVNESIQDRRGQWGVKATYNWNDYSVQMVYQPIWTRSLSPEAGTEYIDNPNDPNRPFIGETRVDAWFPPIGIYPTFALEIQPTQEFPYNYFLGVSTYARTAVPDNNLKSGTFGLRVNAIRGDWDTDMYFVTAVNPLPHPELTASFAETQFNGLPAAQLQIDMFLRHSRLHTFGAATATTWGRLGLRAELTYTAGHYWYRLFDDSQVQELLDEFYFFGFGDVQDTFAEHSSIRATIGGDIEIPNTGIFTSNQLAFQKGFGHKDVYFQKSTEVIMTNAVRRTWIDDHLAVAWVQMVGISKGSIWMQPSLSYTLPSFEDLQLKTAVNIFAGEEFSIVGGYKDFANWLLSARLYF
jgi:hypothetical protein